MSSYHFRPWAGLLALAGLAALAACAPVDKTTTSASKPASSSSSEPPSIERSAAELFNGAKPKMVTESPIPGVYEVAVNGQIYYFSKDGKYAISGEMLKVEGRENLSAKARDAMRKDMMDKLNKKDAIVYKASGTKKEVLNVFTDVECGYCREFHKHIDAYTRQGYEVHYYPWPRSGTSGPVYDEMVSVWCSKDRQKALTGAKSGDKPESKSCDNPVAKYFELGREMGIQGTPAVFLSNGKQIGGYVPPENMQAAIDGANGKVPTPPVQ